MITHGDEAYGSVLVWLLKLCWLLALYRSRISPDALLGCLQLGELFMAQGHRPLVIVHVQTRMKRSGGAEENTWAACKHQADSGNIVHLLAGSHSDLAAYRKQGTNVQLHLVPSLIHAISMKRDYAAYRELRQLFTDLRADVVHTHTSKAGILGRLAARRAGVPIIMHGVHILPFSHTGLAQKLTFLAVEHVTAPITDHFLHVGEGTRHAYKLARLGSRAMHSVVRSGMEIDGFRAASWPDDWRQILGVGEADEKPITILMMAALEARKRHADFLRGFAEVTRKGEKIRLLLAGEGAEAERLSSMVESMDLRDRVKLVGYRPDPHKLVALSDIGVLASLREGLPRVVIQYLAGGKPVVVSALRGIDEIVEDGINGFIVPRDDAAHVAKAAVQLVRDRALLKSLSEGAEHSAVDQWTFRSMFEQLDQVYAKTLETPLVRARIARGHSGATTCRYAANLPPLDQPMAL